MSGAFTAGPWEVQKPNSNDKRRVIAPMQSGFHICGFVRSANDAKLIAAAPELFEAARLFAEVYDAAVDDDGVAMMLAYSNALSAARAALAKARGEA